MVASRGGLRVSGDCPLLAGFAKGTSGEGSSGGFRRRRDGRTRAWSDPFVDQMDRLGLSGEPREWCADVDAD